MSENKNPKVHFPKALKELNKTKAFDRKQSFLGSHTVTWVLGQPNSNKQREVVSQRSVHDCSPTPEMILYLNFFILLFAKINFCLFIEGFYDILPPSSAPPGFKEIPVKLSCFISLCVSVSVCWSVFISICLVLYSKLHCLFNFITQSLNLCCEAMIHE